MRLPEIKVLLFDICGVLFDVSGGVECMLEWVDRSINEEQLLRRWISSSPVKQFELGTIKLGEFALEVVREFNFPVDESQFIDEYVSWHKGPYDGAVELIRRISEEYITASFSNINELQWSKINETGLLDHMSHNFESYPTHCSRCGEPCSFQSVLSRFLSFGPCQRSVLRSSLQERIYRQQ